MPRHNETFGCEIQNLTECIKAKQTGDTGSSQAKVITSYFLLTISFLPLLPAKQMAKLCCDWIIVWTWIPIVHHIRYPDTSDKSNYWLCHSGVVAYNLPGILGLCVLAL